MNIRKALLTVIMFASASALPAQGPIAKHDVSLGWNASIPAGGNQFMDKAGFANISAGYHYRIARTLTVGIAFGYGQNRHSADMRVEYEQDVINGYAKKQMTAIPVQVQARYHPFNMRHSTLQPYISAAAGMQYTKYSITGDNIPSSRMSDWKPAVSVQVAVRLSPRSFGGFFIDAGAGWNYCASKWDALHTGPAQNISLTLAAGYSF